MNSLVKLPNHDPILSPSSVSTTEVIIFLINKVDE